MQGNPQILETLNQLLSGELAARDQYFIHAQMYKDWGLNALYERAAHESEEETGHARVIIERILMLEGTPQMTVAAIQVGQDVPDMIKKDLALEYEVQTNLKSAMRLCEDKQDYVTRDLLLLQLRDTEEDHAYWLEQQLGLIEKIGLQNYLQSHTS